MKKKISIVAPCYNEIENVETLYRKIDDIFEKIQKYNYEIIFIDNHSHDGTIEKLKEIAILDRRVKLILNARNFGHIRSPFHGFLQASGDAVIIMATDLQDPPELIEKFISLWENGEKIIVAVKNKSKETKIMWIIRKTYYQFLYQMSDIKMIRNFTGFGMYDRKIVDIIKTFGDVYPYFRGIIAELGFDPVEVNFEQPLRVKGITKNNFYTLYDMAMLGITNYSKLPIRIATMCGFFFSLMSFVVSVVYLILKIVLWDTFGIGIGPVVIGVFFFASVQLFFVGIIGEYVASIHTQVMNRPHVVEQERINFDE